MDDAPTTLTLHAGESTVTIHPRFGARIGQITVAGQRLLVDLPPLAEGHPMTWGSFAMVPWVGRIRQGRFTFEGATHKLGVNHHDGDGPQRAHAIHGLVFDRPVALDHVSDSSSTATSRLDWTFGGTVTQTIDLSDTEVSMSLVVESTGARLPAEVGWHPWFRKPDRLEFAPTKMYRRDEFGLPTGDVTDPSCGPWDDCFVNSRPVALHYDRPVAPVVTVTSDCDHWVIYDHPPDSTCVEPQSGPPDAFNLTPHIVDPDTPLRRTMRIAW